MENTIEELRKFAEWCEFRTTASLRLGIELAIENYIKECNEQKPDLKQTIRELTDPFNKNK